MDNCDVLRVVDEQLHSLGTIVLSVIRSDTFDKYDGYDTTETALIK